MDTTFAFAVLALTAAAWQMQTGTRSYDINGRPVAGAAVARADGSSRQTVRNLNGREVPIESVEERVVSESPGLRVVEKVIRRHDANGNPGPPEKMRIETRTGAGGETQVSTTTWRGDVNGSMAVAERSVAVTRKTGENADTTVTVERPSAEGRLEVQETREQSLRAVGQGQTREQAVTRRRDLNGRWTDVLRTETERSEAGGQVTENKAEYEAATTGRMRLVRQAVSRTAGAVTETDVFEANLAGRATADGAPPQLTRRQTVERKPVPGGTLEVLSVQPVDPSSPGRLGPARKVEETVCKGACGPAIIR